LRRNAVLSLIEAFQKYGIQVSFDWIVYGSGEGPIYASTTGVQAISASNVDDVVADFQRLLAIKSNRILKALVNDDALSPLYHRGDLLLAVAQPLESLLRIVESQELASPYLVKLKEGILVPRWLVSDGVNWWARLPKKDVLEPMVSNWAGKIVVKIAGDIIETEKLKHDQKLSLIS
jgi:hypothetical protein